MDSHPIILEVDWGGNTLTVSQLDLNSYAKVNLALDVVGKRQEDGYHYVDTIMVPISLADRITLRTASEISVTMTPPLPTPVEANLAYRAARLLQEHTGYSGGACIHIEKAIPVAGGLAGGSTNSAAVLRGLNELWGTGLSQEELVSLAIRLGSDVPFFVLNRPARVQGIGEVLTPVTTARPLWLVLATPDVSKSTSNVYQMYDQLSHVNHPDVNRMQDALSAGNLAEICEALGNVFEEVMLPRHWEIGELKRLMLCHGAAGALMSGAGPTVFGVVETKEDGKRLVERLRGKVSRIHLTCTVG